MILGKINKKKWLWAAITILIIISTTLPFPVSAKIGKTGIDKVFHLLIFAFWSYLAFGFFRFFTIIYGALLALFSEFSQYLIPTRNFSIIDLFFNFLGLGIGIFFHRL